MDKEELKNKLTEEEYMITQEKGTEAPFAGKYWDTFDDGTYHCKVCGSKLFQSDSKYHSNMESLRGWPGFDDAIPGSVEFVEDDSHGMKRTEVICSKCKSHLGHIFDESESRTGKHLCINSCAIDLK
jgi:peptide-methionine (R)-S-oxide reductase